LAIISLSSGLAVRLNASVVVRDLNLVGAFVCPDEANPELVVDADRVLTFPITLERFQVIAGR